MTMRRDAGAIRVKSRRHRDAPHDILYTWHRDAIAQRLVAGGVGGPRQVRPSVREALEPLAFQRREPSNEKRSIYDQLVLPHILAVGPFPVAAGERAHRLLIRRLADQIGGIFVLTGALGGSNFIVLEHIYPLAGEDRMMVCRGQGVGDPFLVTYPVAAVLRLAVDGVAGDAVADLVRHKGEVVPACSATGGKRRRDSMWSGVTGINPMICVEVYLFLTHAYSPSKFNSFSKSCSHNILKWYGIMVSFKKREVKRVVSETTKELISATIQRLSDVGYSGAIIETYQAAYNSLVRFCEFSGVEAYSPEVGKIFLENFPEINPSISKWRISTYRTAIKHLDCTVLNTKMKKGPFGRTPILYEDSRFNDIRDEYKKYLDRTGKTPKDIRGRILCVSRFLKFVEMRGIKVLSDLSANDIYTAFHEATDKGRFRCLVGHFLTYAYKYGLTRENLYLLVPFPVRHKAVPSVFSPDEVERIIASIDRSTNIGKRNYAIVLIAARLGLRASDIAGLTFDSIMMHEGKIKIRRQQKTKVPLTLPLLGEVWEAIDDYIAHARQKSDDERIFLNVANDDPITPANVGKIVELVILASGVETAGKRKGSHSLRSSLATALIEEGNDYATVQQVLGHNDISSTKAYVRVSVEQLRPYALAVPTPSGYFKKILEQGGA